MIIANWKMNGSKKNIQNWMKFVFKNIEIDQKKDCIFCPPNCYLDLTRNLMNKSNKDIKLGSQHVDSELLEPLTGGTNSKMLVDLGCEFVIVGHSEQRIHLKEDNRVISDKIKTSIKNKLKPIFCIGESMNHKRSKKAEDILLEQLSALEGQIIDKCIIAYEPVWAIGTGENAEISYIEEKHSFIKEKLKSNDSSINHISVVYGGSVNLNNYREIYSSNQVDGLLIGGASLNSETFTKIYNMS